MLQDSFGIKKFMTLLLVIFFLLILNDSAFSSNDPPNFETGIRLQDSSGDMKPGILYTAPCVVDWNEDGKKDLLVGAFFVGNVYLYLNSGTNEAPIFTTATKLQADGSDISVPFE